MGDRDDDDRPVEEVEEEAALGGPVKQDGDDRIIERSWHAPEGKRILVPVRIEPKVYFVAERTFLVSIPNYVFLSSSSVLFYPTTTILITSFPSIQNAVFIGTIATNLQNFIPPHDMPGLVSAAFFTFAALLSIAYTAGIFVFQSFRLRKHHAEGLYPTLRGHEQEEFCCVVGFRVLEPSVS